MKYDFTTHGTCSSKIIVDVEDNIVQDVQFIGGCHGNTQGISRLVKGMTVDETIKRLEGINCRGKGTSCPDQLAKALIKIKSK